MMARLKSWWRLRSLREQRLLLVGGALLAGTILWFGILRPIDRGLADARARHARAVLALADARSQAVAIRRLQAVTPPILPGPLPLAVGRLAEEAGFAVARMEPQSDRQVNVVMNAARAQALFSWIDQLERRHGLVVDRLRATANSDATLAVELSVRARGR